MRTINQVLDQAQRAQKVKSDYKLGLCLGIGQNSISNYRTGRSLPDEKAVLKLAEAIGEQPDLLLVEIQAQRVKDLQARAMWVALAKRLQSGFANCTLLLAIAIVLIAVSASPVRAAAVECFGDSASLYIMLSALARIVVRLFYSLAAIVKVCKAGPHVSRYPHPAAVRPA